MDKFFPTLLLLVAGCASTNAYGYTRTYEPLADEEPFAEQATDVSYEDVRRDPETSKNLVVAWFGTVTTVNAQGAHAKVALVQRYHQERHQCSDEFESSCRVTITPKEGGPFTAELDIRPEHSQGRDRIAPGSLLKVYGHVEDAFDDRGGPILKVDYYRHFPAGTYVIAGTGGRMRL